MFFVIVLNKVEMTLYGPDPNCEIVAVWPRNALRQTKYFKVVCFGVRDSSAFECLK
jgi:hypothetical protein